MSDFCLKEGFNCKYCEEGECVFYSMGSGQMIDMPCFDYDEFDCIPKDVLDKIRAEIETLKNAPPCFDDMFEYKCAVDDVLAIIDKYKAESEDE